MTILGELVLPAGGSAWTQSLLVALEQQGVGDKAARQLLARVGERGWLDRQKIGRQTRWTLTATAEELLESGAARIYGFGQKKRQWNRRWLVLLASVPEADRSSRYRMSQRLGWAGFGSVGQGVWLSPWTDTEGVVVEALDELGVAATTFRAEVGAMGSAEALADQAWDLPALRGEYDGFLASVGDRGAGVNAETVDDRSETAASLVDLVHRWRRFPLIDPDLPHELLPPDWPAAEAANRFAEVRAQLLPGAREWWNTVEQRHAPTGWLLD